MPWLTVLQNVELGLSSGLDLNARRKRALRAIDMISLDGFESAFPKNCQAGCVSVWVSLELWWLILIFYLWMNLFLRWMS